MYTLEKPDKSEIKKLGTGQPIDHGKLWEQMEEDRMDRLIRVAELRAAEWQAKQAEGKGGEPPAPADGA